jgi:hypothetical protein
MGSGFYLQEFLRFRFFFLDFCYIIKEQRCFVHRCSYLYVIACRPYCSQPRIKAAILTFLFFMLASGSLK